MITIPVTERYLPLEEQSAPALQPPACARPGVTFALFQKHVTSPFTVRTTGRVTGAARCTDTGAWIPAMAWTPDMERAFLGFRAAARREPTSWRLRPEFVRVLPLMVIVVLVGIGAFAWWTGRPGSFEQARDRIAAVAAAPSPGDYVQAQDATGGAPLFRWYVVRRVTDAAVEVQASLETGDADYDVPTLDTADFSGPVTAIPRETFLANHILGVGGVPGMPDLVLNALPADD